MRKLITAIFFLFPVVAFAQKEQTQGFMMTFPVSLDFYAYKIVSGASAPYANITETNAAIPLGRRHKGRIAFIGSGASIAIYAYIGGTNDTCLKPISSAVDLTGYATQNYVNSQIAAYVPTPLWSNILSKPPSFPPSAHTHTLTDINTIGATAGQAIVFNGTSAAWETISGGGGANWGSIGGSIGSQSDLVSALAGKANTSHTHTSSSVTDFTTAVRASISAIGGGGGYNSTTGVITLTGSGTIDAAPTNGSANAVSSGGTFTALAGKAATSHVHAATDITSGIIPSARLGTGTANSTTILYGDGTYKTAPSGGSTDTLSSNGTVADTSTWPAQSVPNALTMNSRVNTLLGLKQNLITLTTTGSSGAATFNQSTGALNIPSYSGGGGGTPGGADGEIQMNSSGAFAGTPNLLYVSAQTIIKGEMNSSYFGGLKVASLGTGSLFGAAIELDATPSGGKLYAIFSGGSGFAPGFYVHNVTDNYDALAINVDGSIMSDVATVWNPTTPGIGKGTLHLKAYTTNSGGAITFGAAGNNPEEAQAGIYAMGGGFGTRLFFGTSNSFATGSTTRLFIDENGGVGINTTTPQTHFDVNGAIHLSPMAAPPTPSSGFSLYVDSADGKLKAKDSAGTVTNITP